MIKDSGTMENCNTRLVGNRLGWESDVGRNHNTRQKNAAILRLESGVDENYNTRQGAM